MYIIKIARTKRERVQCASNWKQTSAAEKNRYRFEKFSLNAASILEAAMLTGDFWS